ncbi:MAG: hypothetical protein ABSG92_05890 [Conexivisphaerales archaeon]|jgi:hypothetical protein
MTLFGYGIEYYAGVRSFELMDSQMAGPLLAQLHNATGLREFLEENDVGYALLPTPSNQAPSFVGDTVRYGGRAWGMVNGSALEGLLGNSTVVTT